MKASMHLHTWSEPRGLAIKHSAYLPCYLASCTKRSKEHYQVAHSGKTTDRAGGQELAAKPVISRFPDAGKSWEIRTVDIGAMVEFGGGILIVTGFRVRLASLLMILFVIVATGLSHRYWEFADAAAQRAQESHFFRNVSIIGGFLLLYVCGSGRFGLDTLLRRRTT